ncbi:MAG: EF-P lysine aminoacylase EpmA [Pirellulales bacterium]|nr:EF-P lysine aminoacylase EpmA [Pirellulales bacterium]
MDQTGATPTTLSQRSSLLVALRQFFGHHGFLEVETPLLAKEVIPEIHIEPPCTVHDRSKQWLQASPELHMKRLVAAGMPAIYQVTRSFRGNERGPLHNPEFTIVEWYRVGDDMQTGMALLDQLCQTVAKTPPAKRTSYGEAMRTHAAICPHSATVDQLNKRAAELEITLPDGMQKDDRDGFLNLLFALRVQPQIGCDEPEILYHYPASQAALAKVTQCSEGHQVAARFEMIWRGVEVANGYDELTDAAELRRRLNDVNRQREAAGRSSLPIPESLLAAMDQGLPDCSGCALGFDRLAMLAMGLPSLAEARAFGRE